MTDFPTPSGLTEASAIKLCTDAFKQSSTVSQCVSHAGLNFFNEIGSCVDDLRVSKCLYILKRYSLNKLMLFCFGVSALMTINSTI